jgi:hypothetical protein
VTRDEYERLPDALHPPVGEWRLPQFETQSEIDFDQARKITYHRAKLWIREDEHAWDHEKPVKKFVQIMLTLDRDILKSYPKEALADMVKRELVEAFLESMARF